MKACHFPVFSWAASVGCLLLGLGCDSSPPPVAAPALDPPGAAAACMKTYDTNSDGKLDAAEQEKVPALKKHLADYDGDKDGNLTAAEITNRIASWHKQSEIGLLSLQCVVTLDGRPLKDAKVEFLPEAFLGTAIQPASGTTNEAGMAPLAMPADKLPPQVPKGAAFVHVGIYKVSVTHPTAKIPPKYTGASTVLGHEIVQGVRDYEGAKFELSSK